MKGSNAVISNLIILTVGLIFIFTYRRADAMLWVIIVSGIMFIIPGVVYAFMLGSEARKASEGKEALGQSKRSVGWLCSLGAIILGAVMCIKPELFHSLYVYIFSAALFLGGWHHIYVLAKGLKPVIPPVWLYALPLLLVIGAVVMLLGWIFRRGETQQIVLLMTGIGFALYAVTSLLEYIVYKLSNHHKAVSKIVPEADKTEDVEAKEVKDVSTTH